MQAAVSIFFRSKSLFYILLWLHDREEPLFYQDEYRQETQRLDSSLRKHLEALEKAGMVERSDQLEYDGRKWWRRTDSPYWGVFHSFLETMQEIELGEVSTS